ncbi:MAG: hypothetical protein A3F84_16935 [Candidatus Handelsmanbacteria bacterium RIFCSPLOWO2_12_FULL_64_10]|uniref:Uncharacterized protein n=1 Tax=Handelsmanbacteria sp. (strain RIFCSPLOWO2_12_FULL_64_10) TaxID=1817868 RepID=A0A1F6CD07_HANXR|nr:MAG: hypothetical protein A3F84_16935 [Candidatus Handelsmanbacteria bacterium RIFCSPLOWO2_12_FULL_64_10]
MPDDSKNKLAGMIALKQKDVVKTPPKPAAAAPPKPKEPPKPKAMDKLMAARGQVQVTKVAKKPDPPAKPAPKAPPVAAKKMEAALAGVKVVSGKAAGTKSAASAPQAAVKAATQKPKKTPAPRKPSGPGAFTRMVETLKVHIREEIQEIKKELAAQHLFKPFKDGLNSMKKGVSYLKERISEDKSAAGEALKSAYQDVREARKLQVFDRSDPNADIASVAEERQKFGAAFEQLGSIRQRQAPHPAAASPQDESPSEGGATDMGWPVARAEPGDQQRVEAVPRPSGFSPEMNAGTSEGGDIAPVAEERRQAQAFGAALEQLGSIRQREAAAHRTGHQDQQQEDAGGGSGAGDRPEGGVGGEGAAASVGQRPESASSFSGSLSEMEPALPSRETASPSTEAVSSKSGPGVEEDIAPVAEERRQAQAFGAALEQLGSIRQREAAAHRTGHQDQQQEDAGGGSGAGDRPEGGVGGEGAAASVGQRPESASSFSGSLSEMEPALPSRETASPSTEAVSSKSGPGVEEDIAPVAEERRQAQAFGAALEQLGAIRQREAASHRTRPQDQQQEASADASARPSAEVAAASGGASPASGASPEGQPLRAESSPKSGPEMDRGVAPVAEERRGPAQQASGPPPEARLERAALPRPGPEAVGDIAPVAEERRQAAQMGAALEQLGAIRQREAAARRAKVPGQQQAAETPAEGSARPPAEATAASQGTSPQATEPLPAVAQPARVEEGLERAATPSPGPEPGVEEAPSVPSEAPPALTPVQEMRDASEGPSLLQRLMGSQKTAKKKGGVQRKASKTEHQIRAIKALQALFRHPLWRRVILDPAEKPSQVYIPRKTFEANFAEAEFRNAMRAASRLAMGFWADIKELTFDERTIEEVLTFEFPKVRGQEDPDEKQIAEKCDKETAQRIERFVESDEVRLLLRNSGTRLGTFVPSMEIIARIYLSLKKGSDMNPAARLDIQKDVMFKYQKAKYPEKLARRARNVALRYFFEYLIDYGLELYRERKAALMEMKMPDGDREGRFEALREVCCNLAAERASKAVLSAQIILELREQIRGAINDYEMGVEPGAGGKAALTAEEEEEEEAPEQSANPPEEQPKEPSEPVSQT